MFVAGLGVPRDVVELCHEHNVLVVNMCGKVRHAIAAVEAGCDIVVAQGTEAGGHTGQVATMPLVPQVVDAVGDRVPVVAAGGIFDGRGLAAALALGADGVWVGTRFIATPEARAVPRLQGRAAAHRRGRHGHLPRLHRQDDARGRATTTRSTSRSTPTSWSRSRSSSCRSMSDGDACHLGGDDGHRRRPGPGVLPRRPGRRRDRRARARRRAGAPLRRRGRGDAGPAQGPTRTCVIKRGDPLTVSDAMGPMNQCRRGQLILTRSMGPAVDGMEYRYSTSAGSMHLVAPSSRLAGQSRNVGSVGIGVPFAGARLVSGLRRRVRT